jgi:hypothetical protein
MLFGVCHNIADDRTRNNLPHPGRSVVALPTDPYFDSSLNRK